MATDLPLTSGNARVKDARKLSRRSERSERRLFLVDGPKGLDGALGTPGCVVEVFATQAATALHRDLVGRAASSGATWTLVDDRALASLSDAVTPAGVVTLCRFIDRPLVHLLDRSPRLVAMCADVRDPGNAGTIVRTADAAGADAVVLAGSSVDLYNPKTLRASVGSAFHVPVAVEADPLAALDAARAAGLQVLATAADGEIDLHQAGELLDAPTLWLFGNEAHGLPDELASRADHRIRIPIHGRAESLNLSTAAALCLYESARRPRQ